MLRNFKQKQKLQQNRNKFKPKSVRKEESQLLKLPAKKFETSKSDRVILPKSLKKNKKLNKRRKNDFLKKFERKFEITNKQQKNVFLASKYLKPKNQFKRSKEIKKSRLSFREDKSYKTPKIKIMGKSLPKKSNFKPKINAPEKYFSESLFF